MARIAIDCDGVLANFTRGFYEVANTLFPGVVPVDYQPKGWEDFGGLSAKSVDMVWTRIKATPNWWLGLQAHSDNMGELARFFIKRTFQDVWVCTSRCETVGGTVAKQTEMWLGACGLRPLHNYLGVLPVPGSSDKAKVYKYMDVEYSVDDKGATVVDCDRLEWHKAYLLDRPWNQEFKPKRRVKSLGEFLEAIQ